MYVNICSPSFASNSGNNTLTFPRFDCAVVLIFSATARSVPVFSSFAVLGRSTVASTYSSPLTILVDSTYSTVSVSLLGAASTSAAWLPPVSSAATLTSFSDLISSLMLAITLYSTLALTLTICADLGSSKSASESFGLRVTV